MANLINFMSGDLELVYAMPVSRGVQPKGRKTTVKKPEIELLINGKPHLILSHHVIWRMIDIMDPSAKFHFRNYLNFVDEQPENYADMIKNHLKDYPNVLYYAVAENNIIKAIQMEKKSRISDAVKTITHEIGGSLVNFGFDFTPSFTKFGFTANYVKNDAKNNKYSAIEMIIWRNGTMVVGRMRINGLWVQLDEALKLDMHISKAPPRVIMSFISNFIRKSEQNFTVKETRFKNYNGESVHDRNRLEYERRLWLEIINPTE